jgi:predicted transcriptional regulator
MPTTDDLAVQEWINNAADFIACSRGTVITGQESFEKDGETVTYYEVKEIQKEEPWRALHQIRNLLIALALLHKKTAVGLEECEMAKSVVRSTAPVDRAEVMNALINQAGLAPSEIATKIEKSKKTVDRKLKELLALKLVVRYKLPELPETNQPWLWAVDPKFSSFLQSPTDTPIQGIEP